MKDDTKIPEISLGKVASVSLVSSEDGVKFSENDEIQTKVALISVLVVIFMMSIGMIAWVLFQENSSSSSVELYPHRASESTFMPENENQEDLYTIQQEVAEIESDLEEFYAIVNDEDLEKYGELLVVE